MSAKVDRARLIFEKVRKDYLLENLVRKNVQPGPVNE